MQSITLNVQTHAQAELVDITHQVREAVHVNGFLDGICTLFVPHSTAGITLNENWDPDVKRDILLTLADIAPADPRHRHGEGNSPAHILASLLSSSVTILVENGQLLLGTWQGIYLAEFDGPRRRRVFLKLLASS